MELDSKTQISINKVKQELSQLRDGKKRSGRIIPDSIRTEIIKFRHSGWSVINIEKEFGIASSAIYRWLTASQKDNANKNKPSTTHSKNSEKRKNIKNNYQAPKLLKLVQGLDNEHTPERASYFTSEGITQELIMLEFRSGVKIQMPQKLINFEFLKSLNSL